MAEPFVDYFRLSPEERLAHCRERNTAEHEAQGLPLVDTDLVRLATVARLLAGAAPIEGTKQGAA